MAKNLEIIETERLLFRGINESDAEIIVKWRSAPDVYKYFKFPHKITIDEHLNWYFNKYLTNENRFDWICIEKNSGQRIGVFGLYKDNEKAEINYLLAPEAQHKGYATEAIMRLIQYSGEVWSIKSVIAEIHKNNRSSVSVVNRADFQFQKISGDFLVYELSFK